MHYLVLVVSVIGIILAIVFKIYNLSMMYPALLVAFAIVLDILSNTIESRKDKKMEEELKNRVKK